MGRKLTMRDWAAQQKKLADDFGKVVARGLHSGGMRAVLFLQNETSRLNIFDRGGYKRGWKYELVKNFHGVRIFNSSPYASVIEEGRRPGARQPPTSAILPWVRRKLGVRGKAANGVAFVVARAIGRDGIPGKHVLAGAEDKIADILVGEMRTAFREAAGG